jgi:hypothetical protein
MRMRMRMRMSGDYLPDTDRALAAARSLMEHA